MPLTPTQQARVQGFNASRTQRGVSVSLDPNGPAFVVLMRVSTPENEKYPLSNATRTANALHFLKSELETANVKVIPGTVFKSQDGKSRYRVVRDDTNPLDICAVFAVETSATT